MQVGHTNIISLELQSTSPDLSRGCFLAGDAFQRDRSILVFLLVASERQQALVFDFLLPGFRLLVLLLWGFLASVTLLFLLLAGAGRDALELFLSRALGWFFEQDFSVGRRLFACGGDRRVGGQRDAQDCVWFFFC